MLSVTINDYKHRPKYETQVEIAEKKIFLFSLCRLTGAPKGLLFIVLHVSFVIKRVDPFATTLPCIFDGLHLRFIAIFVAFVGVLSGL